jgi:membrane fusion protein (multidrug efflux system)
MPGPHGEEEGARGAQPDRGAAEERRAEHERPHRGLLQRPILLVTGSAVLALAAIGGLVFWLHARNYQNTDDAFIDAHIVRLAPQVAGRVTQVPVNDNQLVEPGQLLVAIDSSDLETRVAQARAQEAQARAEVDNAKVQISVNRAGYAQAQAEIAAAQAQADNAQRDLDRYQRLLAANPAAAAQQQIDQALAQARQSSAQRDAAVRAAQARAEQINASRAQVASGEEQVRAAAAQQASAGINAGYALITAPVRGHVAQKTVAVGNFVQPGTQLLAIVPLDIWVTANFKETQLALMRVGQGVDIRVDACPRDHVAGHVDSIQRGAGQAFGVLPPENATGNYVKVVQRVPVKILIDNPPGDCPLGPGMSVEPRVRVR